MRWPGLLLALALLTLPGPAAATSPTPPWHFDAPLVEGSGLVGEPVRMEVRVRANVDVDLHVVILAPDWVRVEGDAWEARLAAGQEASRSWTLVPTREGFWAVVAATGPDGFGAACGCAYGHASDDPAWARAAATPHDAIPPHEVARGTSAERAPEEGPDASASVSGEHHAVLVTHRAAPLAPWMRHATMRAWVTQSSAWLCDECALDAGAPGHAAEAEPGQPARVVARLDLREGDAYTVWDEVRVRFDVHPDASIHAESSRTTGCRNHRYGTAESWDCFTPSREWRHAMSLRERWEHEVPAPGAGLVAVALAGVALALVRRRR